MSPRLRLVAPATSAPSPEDQTADPKVRPASSASFTRQISTPTALPWRQSQMAELEARLGAPAPIEQLVYRVRRTSPWRARDHGQFEVEYAHAPLGGAPPRRLLFGTIPLPSSSSSESRQAELRSAAIIVALIAAALILPIAAVTQTVSIRGARSAAILDLEQHADVVERRAKFAARRAAEAKRFDRLQVRELSPAQVLQDLNWVSVHKLPGVTISGVHWAHGIAALETSSAASPVDSTEHATERAPRPLRPGVWLWGVATSAKPT